MKLPRFLDMLAIYGARTERWPDPVAAGRLLAQSPEARAALAQAAHLDRALDGFAPQVDPAALARLRGGVQRRVARLPAAEAPKRLPGGFLARHMLLNLSLRFGALAAMAAVGVWIGWAQPMSRPLDPADPLAPIQVYAVPDESP